MEIFLVIFKKKKLRQKVFFRQTFRKSFSITENKEINHCHDHSGDMSRKNRLYSNNKLASKSLMLKTKHFDSIKENYLSV